MKSSELNELGKSLEALVNSKPEQRTPSTKEQKQSIMQQGRQVEQVIRQQGTSGLSVNRLRRSYSLDAATPGQLTLIGALNTVPYVGSRVKFTSLLEREAGKVNPNLVIEFLDIPTDDYARRFSGTIAMNRAEQTAYLYAEEMNNGERVRRDETDTPKTKSIDTLTSTEAAVIVATLNYLTSAMQEKE